ncbi:MAG: hypothetical protein WCF24_06935, partial [Acidimicrobiales bacterium]
LAIGGSPQLTSSASAGTTVDGNSLQGDYCVSANDCWAVGWVYTGGVTGVNCTTAGNTCVPLVENWNGSQWSIVPSQASSGTEPGGSATVWSSKLYSVSCESAAMCVAVGVTTYNAVGAIPSYTQTLIEEFTGGSSWNIVASPDKNAPAHTPSYKNLYNNNALQGVSCTSDQCVAVGQFCTSTPSAFPSAPLSGQCGYRGSASPPPDGSWSDTLIEMERAGGAWTITPSPDVNTDSTWATINDDHLFGVQCMSDSDCYASGYTQPRAAKIRPMSLQWNGTSWGTWNGSTFVTSAPMYNQPPDTSPTTEDNWDFGMTCIPGTSPDVCWTVGAIGGTRNETLAEQYTGGPVHSWTSLQGTSPPFTSYSPNVPSTSGSNGDQLQDISCMSNGTCFAVEVNYYRNGATTLPWNPLIEECTSCNATTPTTPSWTVAQSQNLSPISSNAASVLYGVSCTGTNFCMAVGFFCTGSGDCLYSTDGSQYQTLAEEWNGSGWSITSSPDASG